MGFIILCTRWRSTSTARAASQYRSAVPLAVRTFVVVVLATRFSTSSYIRRGHVGGWVAKRFDRMAKRCVWSSVQRWFQTSDHFPPWPNSVLHSLLPRSNGHFILRILEIRTLNLKRFSAFLGTMILMPIILMGVYRCSTYNVLLVTIICSMVTIMHY